MRRRVSRIKVTTNCVADSHAAEGERIIEFSSPNGGGLISFRLVADGTLTVDVYRTDPTVRVVGPAQESTSVAHYPERPR